LNARPTDYEGVAARPLSQQVPRKCVTRRAYGSLHASYQPRWSIPFSTARAENGKKEEFQRLFIATATLEVEDLIPSTAPGADHASKMSSGNNAETT